MENISKKTLLIIGGSGFFGKSILDGFKRGLLDQWQISSIIILSRDASRLKLEAPNLLDSNVTLYNGDILKIDFLPEADFIIHAAASTDIRQYLNHSEAEKINIQKGTDHFCSLIRKNKIKSKILYVSSGAVYGAQPSELLAIPEDFIPTRMINEKGKIDYGIAKQNAEYSIQSIAKDGFNVSIARCFAFIGPWLPRDQHFAIGNFISNVLNQNPIHLKSNYKVYRSYMYADDLVKWLLTIVDIASNKCPIYNVGSDEIVSLDDLARKLGATFKLDVIIPDQYSKKIDRYIPSIEKAKRNLNLTLSFNVMQGFQETLKRLNEIKLIKI
jgi:nucleoside-diphosphate-sugar epimerase